MAPPTNNRLRGPGWSPYSGGKWWVAERSLGRTPMGPPKPKPAPRPAQDPYAGINASVDAILQGLLAQVQRDQDAARKQYEQDSQWELDKASALAQGLQQLGISQAVQSAFQNAGQAQAGLAQGFSGATRDAASAAAADQMRQLSGTGQEGAVRNQGEAMGNVQYGLHGYIPATELNQTGAAFGAQAALQPGFAMQFGQIEASKRRQEMLEELEKFAGQREDILGKRPELFMDLLKDFSPKSTTPKTVRLADGRYQTVVNGQPKGKPWGPVKTSSSSSSGLQVRPYGDGYRVFDPNTGEWKGPVTPGRTKTGRAAKEPYLRSRGTYDQLWDPNTRKWIGPKYPKTYKSDSPTASGKPKRVDEGGRIVGRTDGVTPTRARDYKQTAFRTAKTWNANGGRIPGLDAEGNPLPPPPYFTTKEENGNYIVSALDLLKMLVNDGNVPVDIAIRQMARFSPKAREWLKSGVNPITGQSTRGASSGKGGSVRPEEGAAIMPASFKPTHETDNLGWPAVDIMGKPGTPVASPASGTIIRHGSAQGGQALYLQADNGQVYWLGHIDGMLPVGTRVRKGQTIASISGDHPSPHVHLAKQSGRRA